MEAHACSLLSYMITIAANVRQIKSIQLQCLPLKIYDLLFDTMN